MLPRLQAVADFYAAAVPDQGERDEADHRCLYQAACFDGAQLRGARFRREPTLTAVCSTSLGIWVF